MKIRPHKATLASVATAALVAGMVTIPAAHADTHVLPGNESDIGVYTDGTSDVMDIGDPVYTNLPLVEAALAHGLPFTAGNMHQSIFEADLAAGGTDYYLDRILGVSGTANNGVLQTRGRTLYMRGNSTWNQMGFAGAAHAGGSRNLGSLYTVSVADQTLTEVGAQRFNAPSHAKATYTVGTTGVTAQLKKFMTFDNVAVSVVTFTNPGEAPVDLTVRAASPIAQTSTEADDELTGTRPIGNTGGNMPANDWATATISLKAPGFTRNGTTLERPVSVPAGGNVELLVVGGLYYDTLEGAEEAFYAYAAKTPADAFRDGVTEFNRQWAADIPYIDVPDPAVEKAIVYRWWGERYNVLDANVPGYLYQYPTTIEGVNLYQNSIVLTQPMHLQDTKWIRNPYLAYGQLLNVGELSGSSAFLDSSGHSSWNNHYSQYLGTAGLEAYQVHGGGAEIAAKFAQYFEGDGIGQLEHYDGDGNELIQYTANYMPGNDSDAISFGFPRSQSSRGIERPESAYVWGSFDAARQLYELAGASPEKVAAMAERADAIQAAVLDTLWNDEMRMFLARTTEGGLAAETSNGNPNPLTDRNYIPARESNLYDVYAEELIPVEDAEDYVDGFRFLRYGDNFPIFPFYTANQYDRAKYGIGGSNNFSNINFTVQYRGVRAALRHYDVDQQYVTPEYAARLLDWMAWSIYPGGNALIPNQAEYYSNWNPTAKTYNRNNPNHVMLGNMNYIYVEDMGGIQPRSDDLLELWPIDLGYDHFMVNNLRYHGSDVTIVWDADGSHYGLGTGYLLFVDGELAATADGLGRFVYDPNTNTVVEKDADLTVTVGSATPGLATAVDTPIEDARVVEYLKTAGIDLEVDAANLALGAEVTTSATQVGERPTTWRNFHTVGRTGAMNYHPGAIAVNERPVSAAAMVDGVTINEPYWGNYGTEGTTGWVEVDLGGPVTFDNVKVFFMQDPLTLGASYKAPQRYLVQIPDGAGGWTILEDQYKSPAIPSAKFNEALFNPVTTDKVRVTFTNAPDAFTAISEIQVFDSGRDIPVVVNNAPVVTAQVDTTRTGNLSVGLTATVKDDGSPATGNLTYGWSLVSAPEGGAAIFTEPGATSTMVVGTLPGTYTVKFSATDGELTTEREIEVALTERAVSAEFGSSAVITTKGTAGWENHNMVNAPTTPTSSNPGTAQGWGTWGVSGATGLSPAAEAWLRYAWDAPIVVTSADIYWYDDNGGTRMPRADTYVIETSTDGTTWTPVTLTGGSTYAGGLVRNQYNHYEFEAADAQYLRVRIWGVQGSGGGTGILRLRTFGDTVETVIGTPVKIRTGVGDIPTLPAELPVQFSQGAYGSIPFTWQPITADQVAETNVEPFVVYGINTTYGQTVPAHVYVRPEMSAGGITISSITPLTQEVATGELPFLPETVEVSYNDGSWDNQAIAVDWDFNPAVVNTPGVYEIFGDVTVPWYVGTTTAQAKITLTVTGEVIEDTTPPVVTADFDFATRTLTLAATDDLSGVASIEYRIGEGEWLTYTAPLAFEAGVAATVSYRATDGSGNISEVATYEVAADDEVAPEVTATFDGAARELTLTATDDLSGVASVEYRIGEGEWLAYTEPVSFGLAGATVTYRATDVAGNVSEVGTVEVPAAAGNVALLGAESASYTAGWNNLAAVNDGEKPVLGGTPENSTFWGTWSGTRPETQWLGYTWDAPVTVDQVLIGLVGDGEIGRGTGIETPESWVVEYHDGDDWVPVANVHPTYPVSQTQYVSVTFDAVTTTQLRAVLTARVGWLEGGINNPGQYAGVGVSEFEVWTEGTGPELGDVVAPELTVTLTPAAPDGADGWYRSPVTLAVSATDAVDPAPGIEFHNGSAWQPLAGSVTVPEGDSSVSLRAVDVAGNRSVVWSTDFQVDSIAPEVTAAFDAEARTVTLTATDAGSGIATVEYRMDDGAWLAYTAPVAVGDAAVTFQYRATDVAGTTSEVGTREIEGDGEVPEFSDVSSEHAFYAPIRWMAERGLAAGYEDGSFRPAASVTRQAMAAFLYRYAGEGWVPVEGAQSFSDVGTDHPFYVAIEWMAETGLSTGYEDGTFRPGAEVSRQAMASFLHRLVGEPVASEPASFTDVPAGHPFAGAIAWLEEVGITEGYEDGSFGVTRVVTRQATAAFLFRLDGLGLEIGVVG